MNLAFAIPAPLALTLVFLCAALLASGLNWAIYNWAWNRRLISPWGPASPKAPSRRAADRLPIFGWLGLQRESKIHGARFWVRPLLVELSTAIGFTWLYKWEVIEQGLYQLPLGMQVNPAYLHAQFLSHVVLLSLAIIASLIDIDEKLIPDQITVTGTLLGLALAMIFPFSLLPDLPYGKPKITATVTSAPLKLAPQLEILLPPGTTLHHTLLTAVSPNNWPERLGGAPNLLSLAGGLFCFWFWCFAILPRPWYPRHGPMRALRICWARLVRSFWSVRPIALSAAGSAAIVAAWYWNEAHWAGMLTALIGMAVGGGVVWAVRIIGAVTLRKEAMGFGDVLLMMMIGTFMGWQACLVIFFLAPFAGLLVGVLQMLIRRDQEIPYGPFLCLAMLFTLLTWPTTWTKIYYMFDALWLVPGVLAVCFAAMAVILLLLQFVKGLFRNSEDA